MKTCIGDAESQDWTTFPRVPTAFCHPSSPSLVVASGDQRPDRYTLLIMNLGDCVFRMTAAAANMYLFQTFHIKDND